jgi:hypothetical protein
LSAYISHFKARHSAPELQGFATPQEKLKAIADEWKNLDAEARKVCPYSVASIHIEWLLTRLARFSPLRRWRQSTMPGSRRRWTNTGRGQLPKNNVLATCWQAGSARPFVHYEYYSWTELCVLSV